MNVFIGEYFWLILYGLALLMSFAFLFAPKGTGKGLWFVSIFIGLISYPLGKLLSLPKTIVYMMEEVVFFDSYGFDLEEKMAIIPDMLMYLCVPPFVLVVIFTLIINMLYYKTKARAKAEPDNQEAASALEGAARISVPLAVAMWVIAVLASSLLARFFVAKQFWL